MFLVLGRPVTSHSLLIITVNISWFISDIDSSCLENINEDLNFEDGDGIVATGGCGATLQNVFWYFGGGLPMTRDGDIDGEIEEYLRYARQVKLHSHIYWIFFYYFRQVKLLDASWSVKQIWNLILKWVHATPSINRMKRFFFASICINLDSVTRKYFCETLNNSIVFVKFWRRILSICWFIRIFSSEYTWNGKLSWESSNHRLWWTIWECLRTQNWINGHEYSNLEQWTGLSVRKSVSFTTYQTLKMRT